jgi:hypothetical protein
VKPARTSLLWPFGFLLCAGAAGAGEIPSPWWQSRMNESFSELPHVRLQGPRGFVVIRKAQADSTGVHYQGVETSPGWYEDNRVSPGETVPPGLIPWSDIDRVEKPVHATGLGALVGGVIGTAVAVAIGASGQLDQEGDSSEIIPAVFIAGGVGLGAIVGSSMTRWELFYPQPVRGVKSNPTAINAR